MKGIYLSLILIVIMLSTIQFTELFARDQADEEPLRVSMQSREPSGEVEGAKIISQVVEQCNPSETAIIISDMWDKHWCEGATGRVAEMAPFMNDVISIARNRGVLIVHAPSGCTDYYKDHPARALGQKYLSEKARNLISGDKLDSEKDAVWPIDQSDGGCDCPAKCKQGRAWTRQIDLIEITDNDAIIDDSGAEIGGLLYQKGIKNVILMGVHTNMCVIGRSFGLRNMVRLGMNVVLMRDMTDTMYNSESWPNVNHFTGNSLVNEYIETYVSPSILSSDFTGEKQFRFKNDNRPVIAFISAEGEYRSNQRFPEFARELLLTKDVNVEFATGKPVMEGEGRHNIENLQILKDADLAVMAIRRRAMVSEQMNLIKEYVNSGKPVLGIRTTSHAFDARGVVPREGGGIVAAKEGVSEFLYQWPEFDKDVLGGNYQGHYARLQEGTKIIVVPGMENHVLLEGVEQDGFSSPNWLYRNRPLRSDNAQVLLLGTIPDVPSEPVMWINTYGKGKIIYTSLGHWDDWKLESFRNLMLNSIKYLLNL